MTDTNTPVEPADYFEDAEFRARDTAILGYLVYMSPNHEISITKEEFNATVVKAYEEGLNTLIVGHRSDGTLYAKFNNETGLKPNVTYITSGVINAER